MGEMTNSYGTFVGKPEEKIPHARRRRRWEGNIRMDLKEVDS
jgi:hypothetical protein